MSQKSKEIRDATKLKASHAHTQSKPVQDLREACLPEYRATWEAGRACGFHAGFDVGIEAAQVRKMASLLLHIGSDLDPVPGKWVLVIEEALKDYDDLVGKDASGNTGNDQSGE